MTPLVVIPVKKSLCQTFFKLSRLLHKERDNPKSITIWQHWDFYLSNHSKHFVNKSKHFETKSLLMRFEFFEQSTHMFFPSETSYELSLENANGALIEAVWNYARYESEYVMSFPSIFEKYNQINGSCPRIVDRCDNTATQYAKHFRAFLNWCMNTGRTSNREFLNYEIRSERYRAPFYLTIAERNIVRDHKFTSTSISRVRDIFLFQCFTGERYSDLYRFSWDNIIEIEYVDRDGQSQKLVALSYIPQKISREKNISPIIIPLEGETLNLIEKYRNIDSSGRLFPVPSLTYYNRIIKKVLRDCGINRQIEVLDQKTGKLIHVPIWNVAGSHIARRTCIGSLFKLGINRDVIASISGHSKGSKAISRYYEVDTEQKVEALRTIQC